MQPKEKEKKKFLIIQCLGTSMATIFRYSQNSVNNLHTLLNMYERDFKKHCSVFPHLNNNPTKSWLAALFQIPFQSIKSRMQTASKSQVIEPSSQTKNFLTVC